jgi:FkbM family methyltransferase
MTDASGTVRASFDDLRARVVKRGIKVMCGPSTSVPVSAAADVPILTAGLRLVWLRALGAIGVRDFVAASGLGYDFVCHIGDLAEFPYYHRSAFQTELEICAAWLEHQDRPVIYDVGANVGFFATQLAQMLGRQQATIYAFEPVPTTFAKLVQSVRRLHLEGRIWPVAAAVFDEAKPLRICYSPRNSLYAQVTPQGLNERVGDHIAFAAAVTLDAFETLDGATPALIKIDVEGSEVSVLRGAQRLLSRPDRPALMLEYNPVTLSECGAARTAFQDMLAGYRLYYIDDIEGQKLPVGSAVEAVEGIGWICNMFAVPAVEGAEDRWRAAFRSAMSRLEARQTRSKRANRRN